MFLKGRRNAWVLACGLILLCIPQILYIYAYANSDAWGLSVSVVFFVFLLTTKTQINSPRYAILLGFFVGLLLLSKETFWLSLPWAGVLVGTQYFQQRRQNVLRLSFKQIAILGGIFIITVLVIIAPLKLIYPLTQGDWNVRVEQMREIRAWNDFKPSILMSPGYRLSAKGEPITVILHNRHWYAASMKSFYGVFGHFTVILPDWIYIVALGILVLNVVLTISIVCSKWSLLDLGMKAMVIFAPFSVLLNVAASVYNSWTYDFQPQGRYLFSSVVPLTVLLTATVPVENKQYITLRVISWLISYGLCMYVLIHYAM